jgi:hypothetical protein
VTPEERKTQREIHELLDRVAEQQAESSLSRQSRPDTSQRASTGRDDRDASVHQAPRGVGAANLPLIREHVSPIRDACVILDAHRRGKDDRGREADHGCHPQHGGHYDANKDWSSNPPPPGPQAFTRHILRTSFPQQYRASVNVLKYSGESNPDL